MSFRLGGGGGGGGASLAMFNWKLTLSDVLN